MVKSFLPKPMSFICKLFYKGNLPAMESIRNTKKMIIFETDSELDRKVEKLIESYPYKISKSALLRLLITEEYERKGLKDEKTEKV